MFFLVNFKKMILFTIEDITKSLNFFYFELTRILDMYKICLDNVSKTYLNYIIIM